MMDMVFRSSISLLGLSKFIFRMGAWACVGAWIIGAAGVGAIGMTGVTGFAGAGLSVDLVGSQSFGGISFFQLSVYVFAHRSI